MRHGRSIARIEVAALLATEIVGFFLILVLSNWFDRIEYTKINISHYSATNFQRRKRIHTHNFINQELNCETGESMFLATNTEANKS